LSEAELEVDSDKASYKQKLEVLQQQEELIEDEEEQEQKEEDARRAKREADEAEARTARSLLPESEVKSLPIHDLVTGTQYSMGFPCSSSRKVFRRAAAMLA
jgi:hypothetical protein